MLLGQALSWTAERHPERTAVAGERSLTYREWDLRTNRLARAFGAMGIERGDRVAVVAGNSEPLASVHLACQKLGVGTVPLSVRYEADELAYCLDDAAPKALVCDETTASLAQAAVDRLDAGRPRRLHAGAELDGLLQSQPDGPLDVAVSEDDVSVMLYTAGTTGRPKGVPRSHHAEVHAGIAHVLQARYSPAGEATLCAMPMYHTMGLRSLVSMVLIGGTTTFLPRFDPEQALEVIARDELSALYLVPTAFWALLQQSGAAEGCASVRKLAYAGAAMTENLTTQLATTVGPEVFINHYGSTEVYTFAVESDAIARPGSAGRPGVFTRLRLVAADPERRVGPDEVVSPGETGEIIASLESDEAFAGYWQRDDANERALRDGWYFTGDLGEIDDEGNLRVSGRIDDMVITGGENVHPLEVEDAIARCADVGEVAVAGLPDDKWGHAVTAFVVVAGQGPRDDEARRIAEWTRAQSGLAAYKRPKRIVILDALPKSPVGKILRRELVAGNYEPLGEATP